MQKENNKGLALIMAVAIVGILSAIGINFAFNMKLDQQAVGNYVNGIKARYLAESGISRAIAELKNALSLYTYDAEGQNWNSLSETMGAGNYSVTVTDESSKININNCGNLSNNSNEGYTTFEISLENTFTALGVSSPSNVAQGIINYRHGSDNSPGGSGSDDDGDIGNDGIDNNGDGTIDEANENQDEPDEFCLTNPSGDDMPFKMIEEVKCCSNVGDATYTAIKDYVTVSSYDKIRDSAGSTRVNVNETTAPATIETALTSGGMAAAAARQVAVNIVDFIDSGSTPTTYTVGAVNYIGEEITPYINEIMADTSCPDADGDDGEFVELYNPWSIAIDVGNWTIAGGTIPGGTTIAAGGYLIITDQYNDDTNDPEANGGDISETDCFVSLFGGVANYAEITSLDLSSSASTIELRDSGGNLIDEASYSAATTNRSQERNDPRVDSWTTHLTGETAGVDNSIYNPSGGEGLSTFYVKDGKMANIGEAGLIHSGGQWTTVNLQSGGDWGIIDYLTVSDSRYDGFDNDNDGTIDELNNDANDELKVYGRININTASTEVLQGLPGITSTLATNIISYRSGASGPFDTIGEIVEVTGMDSLGSDGSNNDSGVDTYTDEDDENELIFRTISNLISVRSNVFMIESTGRVISAGETLAEKKIRAIVDRGVSPVKYLYYREVED